MKIVPSEEDTVTPAAGSSKDAVVSGTRPRWLERGLTSRRPSLSNEVNITQQSDRRRRMSLGDKPLRTLRELPEHLRNEDSFGEKYFDWKSTKGISAEPCGEGCQAVVYSVKHRDKLQYAIKVLLAHLAVDPEEMRAFQREVNLLSRLDHPNVCKFIAVGTTPGGAPCVMLEWLPETIAQSMRLGELTHGSTKGLDQKRHEVESRWPGKRRLLLARQFAEALSYLHSRALNCCCILHRDLKPDNLAISTTGQLKLIDFGLAVCLVRDDDKSTPQCSINYQLTGQTGSIRYMSPECALSEEYGTASDVYSFAIASWEFLVLHGKPYADLDVLEHKEKVVLRNHRPKIPHTMNKELATLLRDCWHPKPECRPDFDTIACTISKIYNSPAANPLLAPRSALATFSACLTCRGTEK